MTSVNEPVVAAGERERFPLQEGPALCLSGGGYRAMLFHVGALWRLNETGTLARLQRVSSVSGGSIAAALLALRWPRLGFDPATGVAARFVDELVEPLRRLAAHTVDLRAILTGLLLPGTTVADRVAASYRRWLFGDATLQDLPDTPTFVINATNVQSGALWRFRKEYLRDWRVGEVPRPRLPLAAAVAASSAFPPVLSPATLRLRDGDFRPGSGQDLQRPPYTTRVRLTDGGVYDNLGLETAWKRCRTILVSDGGGALYPEPWPWRLWPLHAIRVLFIIDNQVRSLRKRQLIEAFRAGLRSGAYWGIRSNVLDYQLADALPCPHERTLRLADLSTRLAALGAASQECLINWGYAACDVALRRHVDPGLAPPRGFPYPCGVG
jgi:NTE family protein